MLFLVIVDLAGYDEHVDVWQSDFFHLGTDNYEQ
jgi:hypothetical protein